VRVGTWVGGGGAKEGIEQWKFVER
jgi:hypothetical protein